MSRVFIAVPVKAEPQFLDACLFLRNHTGDGSVKWVGWNGMHLTLKFLGEVDEKTAGEIKGKLIQTIKGFSSFEFTLKGFGFFGPKKQPTVVYAGIENHATLGALAEKIDCAMEELGFERESRPFKAHITIGRIKFLKDSSQFLQAIGSWENRFIQRVRVDSLVFYKSILTSGGPLYQPLLVINLLE